MRGRNNPVKARTQTATYSDVNTAANKRVSNETGNRKRTKHRNLNSKDKSNNRESCVLKYK